MSIFGAPSTQQPGQSGGMFGGLGANTNTQQQPSSGLFGNTSNNTTAGQTAGTGGGIFGNPGASGGGLFGSTSTNNTQTQNQGGGGLFGNANTQPQQPSGGGIFGNTNANTNTQQQQPGGGLFGNTNSNTTNQQPSAGGGLFGNTSTNTNTSTNQPPSLTLNTGGGLFGNTNTSTSTNPLFGNKPPGSIFGNTSTAPAAGSTTNSNPLFGGGSTNNPQQQQPTTGLFGNTNTQPQQQQPTGGLFGSTNPQQQQQPTGSLFGQPQQSQQQQNPTSSLFGSTNINPLTTSALNPPANNQGGGLFGNTLSSTNNLASTARGPGGEADAQTQFAALTKRIEGIACAWNSEHPECRFQHYFYNLVDPNQVNLYGRPEGTNEALWQKAVRENPDRTCLVPVIAKGFNNLRERVEAQSQVATSHQEKLKDLKDRIEALSQRHAISNASRLSRASTTQTQITHRLLKLIQHLHLLIPALRSSAIRPEEESWRVPLEEIEEEVRRGRLRGKLNELWAVVGALLNGARSGKETTGSGTEWAVVDEEGLGQIVQILAEQQAGLQHLTKILQQDLKDLAVIQGKGGEDDGQGLLLSSTSTLRASALQLR